MRSGSSFFNSQCQCRLTGSASWWSVLSVQDMAVAQASPLPPGLSRRRQEALDGFAGASSSA